jgi:predicted ATPase
MTTFDIPGSMSEETIRTPDQRIRVFVSSTLGELAEERIAVRAAIERLHLAPVMFELGARPHAPRDLYRAYLRQSHVFVGIYAERYGWVAPGESISGLEDEFRLSEGLPRLLYLKRPASAIEPRLKAMLAEVSDRGSASYRHFGDATQLAGLVEDDLSALLSERFMTPPGGAASAAEGRRRTRPAPPPVPLSPTVGRDSDIAAVARLVDGEVRLLTLTGAGGVGKTRLALEVVRAEARRFPDGVAFVPLEDVPTAELVLPALADTLRLPQSGGRPALDRLTDELTGLRLLLVLDNMEHLCAAGPDLAALLGRCPRLVLLITSRQALRLREEREYRLAPLPVPADDKAIGASPAVQLFVQRATAVHAGFLLTHANRAAVAEIVRLLDGLPLAIELAAARSRLFSPGALADRLRERLDLLGGGPVDLPARQRTLRATMDWSFGLLGQHQQAVFTRLGVFSGGWTLEAAETVCGRPGEPDVLDALAALLNASLVATAEEPLGEPRMDMLETGRSYAVERHAASPDRAETERRHTDWMLATSDAHIHVRARGFRAALECFDRERANLRAAMQRAIDTADAETAGLLIRNSFPYLVQRDALWEAVSWLEQILPQAADAPAAVRGRLLLSRAIAAGFLGDLTAVRPLLEEGRRLLPDDTQDAWDRTGTALAGYYAALADGAVEDALRCLDEATAGFTSLGEEHGLTVTAVFRASLALRLEDLENAERHYRAALELTARTGNEVIAREVLAMLGLVLLARGDVPGGRRFILDAAVANRLSGSQSNILPGLVGLASVALADGRPGVAARALAAAGAARQNIARPLWPVLASLVDDLTARIREQMGDQAYEAARAAGRDWALLEALDQTLEELAATDRAETGESPSPATEGAAVRRN